MGKRTLGENTFYDATKPLKPIDTLAAIVTSQARHPRNAIILNLGNIHRILDDLFSATIDTEQVRRTMTPEAAESHISKCLSVRRSCYQSLKTIHDVNYDDYNQVVLGRLREFVSSRNTPLPRDLVTFLRGCKYFISVVTLQPKPHISRSS